MTPLARPRPKSTRPLCRVRLPCTSTLRESVNPQPTGCSSSPSCGTVTTHRSNDRQEGPIALKPRLSSLLISGSRSAVHFSVALGLREDRGSMAFCSRLAGGGQAPKGWLNVLQAPRLRGASRCALTVFSFFKPKLILFM